MVLTMVAIVLGVPEACCMVGQYWGLTCKQADANFMPIEHYFLSYLLHSRWQKLVRVDGDEDDDDADANSNR